MKTFKVHYTIDNGSGITGVEITFQQRVDFAISHVRELLKARHNTNKIWITDIT